MVDYASKDDLKNLENKIDKRFDDLTQILGKFANDVNDRFDGLESRIIKVETKQLEHDKEFVILNNNYDRLLNTIDGFLARIDNYETEQAARDHKVDRLEKWIEIIAKETGVKLPV